MLIELGKSPREMESFDWESNSNFYAINPRFPTDSARELLYALYENEAQFQSHVFLLTSGTTSQTTNGLRWVVLSKRAFLSAAQAVNLHLASDSSDTWLHPLPDFHVGGIAIWARARLSGAKVVKISYTSPENLVAEIEKSQATLIPLVPAQIFDLVQSKLLPPPSLRTVIVGAGAMSFTLYKQALDIGWPLLPAYGMTEACSQIATVSPQTLERGSVLSFDHLPPYQLLSHLEARIGEGECLELKGPALLTAYIGLRNGEAKVQDPFRDGWFVTGDRAQLERGHLRLLGRQTDFVKIGGESVEVQRLRDIFEGVRVETQSTADAAILAVPDVRLGHVIHLYSDRNLLDSKANELIERFNSRVLAFEKIRQWKRLDFLPRTDLGKLIPSKCLDSQVDPVPLR